MTSETLVTGSPAAASARAVPPVETSSKPRSVKAGGELHQSGLVRHAQQARRMRIAHQISGQIGREARRHAQLDLAAEVLK